MIRTSIILSVVLFVAGAVPAFAQDAKSKNQTELPSVRKTFSNAVTQIQNYSDIARRELLKTTSDRNLQFRCGRYWVDVYSKLIGPDDREVGIWGVDLPGRGQIPIVPMRR